MRKPGESAATLRRGQALVALALSMAVICGFMALAVDLGLAYVTRKAAQSAADAAALAGVGNALRSGAYGACTALIVCQAATPCGSGASSPPTTFDSACLYASGNGFSTAGNGGQQTVSVASNIGVSPFAPGVVPNYWVMVEVTENIPQIFAGVLGNTSAFVRVRSVAAIVQVVGAGSAPTVALVQ